jgi:hypothetical protein
MQWNVETIDQILTEGDKMYLNAFEKDLIPDSETISLIQVVSQQTNVKSPLWVTNTELPLAVEAQLRHKTIQTTHRFQ